MSDISPTISPGRARHLLAADVDAGRAVEDDERLLAGTTRSDQLGAGLGVDLLGQLRHPAELLGREALEEGDVGELGATGRRAAALRAGHRGST